MCQIDAGQEDAVRQLMLKSHNNIDLGAKCLPLGLCGLFIIMWSLKYQMMLIFLAKFIDVCKILDDLKYPTVFLNIRWCCEQGGFCAFS